MEKIYLDWQYVDDAIESLAHQIKSSELNIEYIFGMPRGGLIPAVMLSHRLDIPLFKTGMTLSSKILIIDDICDSGVTLHKYNVPTATIQYKESAMVKPDFYYSLAKNDSWYYYPWELKDSKTIQDYATKRI
jgi:uncharacterized protein